jgi:chromosome transmission fidelity protein 18
MSLVQAERLAQRLQVICAAEGLRCEKSTLRLLVERTECDIRSCLNTLQVRVAAVWLGG